MRLTTAASILPLALPMGVASLAAKRGLPANSFGLYAYGADVGGLPLIYKDGNAFLGTVNSTNNSAGSQVVFTPGTESDDTQLLGNPNVTDFTAATWNNATLYLPDSSSSSRQVGFNTSETDDVTATGFFFYSSTAMHLNSDGSMRTDFYAVATDSFGLFSLNWNASADTDDTTDKIPVALKTVSPSFAGTK